MERDPLPWSARTDVETAQKIQHFATRLIRIARTTSDGPKISSAQYSVMAILNVTPGLSVVELARFEHVTHPTMSRMVAGMVRASLVTRERNERDSRSNRLKLTALGERTYEEVAGRRTKLFQLLLSQLSPAAIQEILDLIDRSGSAFERALRTKDSADA